MTDRQVGVSGRPVGSRASDVVVTQVKKMRARRGYTVKQLAARCVELGAPDLTANVLTNMEVRRRDVSVDELLVLALALDVAPIFLLAPATDATVGLVVTHDVVAEPDIAGLWIRGDVALPDSNIRLYQEHATEQSGANGRSVNDHAAAVLKVYGARLGAQYEAEAQQFLGNVREQVAELLTYLEDSVARRVPAESLIEVLQTVRDRVQPAGSALTVTPHA